MYHDISILSCAPSMRWSSSRAATEHADWVPARMWCTVPGVGGVSVVGSLYSSLVLMPLYSTPKVFRYVPPMRRRSRYPSCVVDIHAVSSAKASTPMAASLILYLSGKVSCHHSRGSRKRFHLRGARELPCPRPHSLVKGAVAPTPVRMRPYCSRSMLMCRIHRQLPSPWR